MTTLPTFGAILRPNIHKLRCALLSSPWNPRGTDSIDYWLEEMVLTNPAGLAFLHRCYADYVDAVTPIGNARRELTLWFRDFVELVAAELYSPARAPEIITGA